MKRNLMTAILLCVLLAINGPAFSADFTALVQESLASLALPKGDRNLLLLTNAPYVRVNGEIALDLLDTAQEASGCKVGKGNLLFFQRPQDHPPRLLFMSRLDGKTVILSFEGGRWLSETVFLDRATIETSSFWEKAKALKAGKDIATLAAIAAVWANDGPYDFLKSAELHDHICPGLTSGYLLAHYIQNNLPLGEGERYLIIAAPVWCKEDALQIILGTTPGKKGMVVMNLSDEQKAAIPFANPAGIVVVYDSRKQSGKGYALTFDFDKLRALAPPDSPKATTVLAAIGSLGKPERFVDIAARFDVDQRLYDSMTQAGANPYHEAGLARK